MEEKRKKFDRNFENIIRILLKLEKEKIITTVQNSNLDNVLKNCINAIEANKANWESYFKPEYNKIVKFFMQDTIAMLNKKSEVKLDITTDISDYINDFTANKITLISGTTKDEIKFLIMKNLEEGKDIKAIEKDLKDKYNKFSDNRANMIARTEVGGISNYGSIMGAVEADAEKKKWIPILDRKTRKTHFNMWSVKAIPLLNYFQVGSSQMQYPGDPNGAAKEIVRCRCMLKFTK